MEYLNGEIGKESFLYMILFLTHTLLYRILVYIILLLLPVSSNSLAHFLLIYSIVVIKNKVFMKQQHLQTLKSAQAEREVEQVYNEEIRLYFPDCEIMHPYKCDGYIEDSSIRLLIEYKLDELFDNRIVRGKVIMQVLFYLHIFRDNGIFPNVVLVGDKNECFVLGTSNLVKYLDYSNIDWGIAPSVAYSCFPALLSELSNDNSINPFVFDIKEGLDFGDVISRIKDIANGVESYMEVNVHNISRVFDIFKNRVIKEKKISAHDLVGLFIGCVIDRCEYYKHPNRVNRLVSPLGIYEIDGMAYDSFFGYFKKEYSCSEIKEFKGIADRLIEDIERRNSGDFFTPTLFCDYAQKMIDKELGENWRDEYAVYDPAAGTKNLTRDYKFKELYCSTLYRSELDMGKEYNNGSVDFVFDFLNDWFPMGGELVDEGKVPNGLIKALKENRKIVFLLNPPYGKSTGGGGKIASGNSESKVKEQMKKDGIEGSELLKQFLYRIAKIKQSYNLTNLYVCCFTNPSWLLKPQSKKFREMWLKEFSYIDGMMFCASEFADCASNWGITFNIWKVGECENKNEFLHKLIERNAENGEIDVIGQKILYNYDKCDVISPAEYINSKIIGKKAEKDIIICKDIKTMEFEKVKAKVFDNYICMVGCFGSDVQPNNYSCLRNVVPEGGGYLQCTKDNILESCVCLAIRRLITDNWIEHNDMYNMNIEIPTQFKLDCLVWSIFTNYCCSYRLNGEELKNEFFFMGKDEILELADKNGNRECYNDCAGSKDRFVYEFIKTHYDEFSEDAKGILEKAKELVRKSFQYRGLFNDLHSEYQINNWDCGYAQLKPLWKMFYPQEFNDFKEQYKFFSNKLRPRIYELGFLKQ